MENDFIIEAINDYSASLPNGQEYTIRRGARMRATSPSPAGKYRVRYDATRTFFVNADQFFVVH